VVNSEKSSNGEKWDEGNRWIKRDVSRGYDQIDSVIFVVGREADAFSDVERRQKRQKVVMSVGLSRWML